MTTVAWVVRAFGPADRIFGLSAGGVCRAVDVTIDAVGSYPTFSPLALFPEPVCFLWHFPSDWIPAGFWPVEGSSPRRR
jgi:hypothetical protein